MTRPSSPPETHSTRDKRPAADQDKPHTPDRYASNEGRKKGPDMPDTDPERNHAVPEDYERLPPDRPRR